MIDIANLSENKVITNKNRFTVIMVIIMQLKFSYFSTANQSTPEHLPETTNGHRDPKAPDIDDKVANFLAVGFKCYS